LKEKPEGFGRLIKLDINMYEGEFKNGVFHGEGFFTDYISEYKGEFYEGLMDGEGEWTNIQSGERYVG
jgi:hypothetical protein